MDGTCLNQVWSITSNIKKCWNNLESIVNNVKNSMWGYKSSSSIRSVVKNLSCWTTEPIPAGMYLENRTLPSLTRLLKTLWRSTWDYYVYTSSPQISWLPLMILQASGMFCCFLLLFFTWSVYVVYHSFYSVIVICFSLSYSVSASLILSLLCKYSSYNFHIFYVCVCAITLIDLSKLLDLDPLTQGDPTMGHCVLQYTFCFK